MSQILSFYQVDAFTPHPFKGNPAAVCLLEEKIPPSVMKSIAAEMNLSETAFVRPLENNEIKDCQRFSLRWFTPTVEVSLCGHATLAAGAVLFFEQKVASPELRFSTLSGELKARKEGKNIILDFPANPPSPISPSSELLESLGVQELEEGVYSERTQKLLLRLSEEEKVKNLRPDFKKMMESASEKKIKGVIVTSSSKASYDFISRFFAPWMGIEEDPVTGAAHTVLGPYWGSRLGKKEMRAYQASSRGGEMLVRLVSKERVELVGSAVTVIEGKILL